MSGLGSSITRVVAAPNALTLGCGIADFEVPAGSSPPAGASHAPAIPHGLHTLHIRVSRPGLALVGSV
jgi:hypothetical protein